jgi:glycosyltransferase involved in cell wall biosynthesis
MKRLLYITPHLSTGGLPQYLLKKIQLLINEYDIHLIEWSNHSGGLFVVQRDQLIELLGNKFYELGENKSKIFDIIKDISPDVIHLEEFPEFFMDSYIAKQLYRQDREYAIVETSHDSSFTPDQKQFFPDHYAFISEWHNKQYDNFIPKDIVYYPIEYKERPNRNEALQELGLDPNKKHILHVGLFTPRKNQAEFFEYAKALPEYEFHCIGNQAGNFQHYWQPLMENKPSNVNVWGERKDVDNFYKAMDLFLFTSRGTNTDKETMPLVIREATSWLLPTLIYNLPVYLNYWDQFDNIDYLDFNDFKANCDLIKTHLNDPSSKEIFVVSTYPINDSIIQTTKQCIEALKQDGKTVMLTSHIPIPEELTSLVDYTVIDNNNILTKHTYYSNFWAQYPEYKVHVNLRGNDNDVYHGPTVYTNYHNGVALANNLGYEVAYLLNYDYILKDSDYIDQASIYLMFKEAFVGKYKAAEGDTIYTFFMGVRTKEFLKTIPQIDSALEYDKLQQLWGSESNGLENLWYHAFKNSTNVYYEDEDVFNSKVEKTFYHADYSRVEYYTVLPTNKVDTIAPYIRISNSKETKIIKAYTIQGNTTELIDSIEVTSKLDWYKLLPNTPGLKIKFEIYDLVSQKLIETKTLHTNNLEGNGYLELANINKIKLMHLVTDPENNPKEIRSIENIKDFCDKTGIVYEQRVNVIWKETPPSENCARPTEVQDKPGYYKLAPGHYGCYLAHKNAILAADNQEYDYVLIFEGDVIIDSDYTELYDALQRFSRIAKETDMDIIGFGNPWQNRNLNGPKVEDIYTDVTPFVPAQSYLINQGKIERIVDLVNSTPWDAFDLWVCNVAKLRVGTAEKIYTKHLPGFSIVEQEFKGTDENSPLIYATE